MVLFNRRDKFLEKIVNDLMESKALKKHKGNVSITAYGVNREKEVDVSIHPDFRALSSTKMKRLMKFLAEKGLRVEVNNHWEHAKDYEYNVIGRV